MSNVERWVRCLGYPRLKLHGEKEGVLQATLVVSEQNKPCRFPDRLIAAHSEVEPKMGFAKAGLNLRGLVGWVDQAGVILPGDEVKCEITPEGRALMED